MMSKQDIQERLNNCESQRQEPYTLYAYPIFFGKVIGTRYFYRKGKPLPQFMLEIYGVNVVQVGSKDDVLAKKFDCTHINDINYTWFLLNTWIQFDSPEDARYAINWMKRQKQRLGAS